MTTTSRRYDAIVIGVGGMGSAAVYHLAKRGKQVLGLERYDIPNAMGSSHGVTRIIRLAYYEHPSYVPLLRQSYALWRELEKDFGEKLLYITGSIDAGPEVFEGSRRSCELHNLPYEVLTGKQLTERYPGYRLPLDTMALLQPEGGFLLSERCIVAHVMLAMSQGAEVHGREKVLDWEPLGDGVRVRTDRATYEAGRLVITAGAWATTLMDKLAGLAVPERQVLAWLQPSKPELFTPERFPVFNLVVDEGRYYGFPVFSVPGFKFGRYHHLDEQVDADTVDREGHSRDEQILREFAEKYFPDGAGPTMALKVCMFTNSPDEHFILDLYPDYPQVSFAAGFSGHGYKFCSLVGEVMSDLAVEGDTRHDIGLLRYTRFARRR